MHLHQPPGHLAAKNALYFLVVALCLAAHWWLLTEGTWSILGGAFKGNAFDDLALNVMRTGHPSVNCSILINEALKVGDTCYMYFAPWPAILRMPVLLVAPEWQSSLSRPSCILAATLGIVALAAIFYRSYRTAPLFSSILLLGSCLGTPVFFLSNSTNLFHEPIMWSLAATFWCLAGSLATLDHLRASKRWFFVATWACALAIISRVTLGVLCIGTVTLVSAYALKCRLLPIKTIFIAALPILGSVMITAWYNYARFGSILTLVAGTGQDVDVANQIGLFKPSRIVEHLRFYFEPISAHFTQQFPFFRMAIRGYSDPSHYHPWREPIVPLSLVSPWIIISFLLALCTLIRSKCWTKLLISSFLVVCWMPMLMHLFSTQRYTAELMPAMIFTLAATLGNPRSIIYHRASMITLSLIVLLSIFNTVTTMSCWTGYWVGTMWFSPQFRGLVRTLVPLCSPLA